MTLRNQFRFTPVTMTLITLSVLSILVMVFSPKTVITYLAADPRVFPWTVITYPFVNASDPLGYAFMLVWLWWIGSSLETHWGSRKFLVAWLTLAVVHDLAFLLCSGAPYVGLILLDSTLTVCWTLLNPGRSILFMFIIPLSTTVFRYITLVGIFVGAGLPGGPLAGVLAVLIALAAGYWTLVAPGRQIVPGRRATASKPKPKSRAKLNLVHSEKPSADAPLPSAPVVPTPLERDIDRILDKIRVEGMAALTAEEKNLLDEHSSRLRRGG